MKLLLHVFIYCLFLLFSGGLFAQVAINGVVKSNLGEALPGAIVVLKKENRTAATDENGQFSIANLPVANSYGVAITLLGYESYTQKVVVVGNEAQLNITLKEKRTEKRAVEITAKTEEQRISQGAETVTAIDVREVQNRSITTQELLTRSSGVRVRETGGLGSFTNISINGISGKQIKFFIDGIPLENTGYGTGIINLPVNLIDRIEVYKGITPVYLGADALGGAINIVSNKDVFSYADFSYERSTYNTSRLSVNTRALTKSKKAFVGLNGYYNHSDNDYKIDGEIQNTTTFETDTIRARRFHDQFTSYSVQAEAGVLQQKWANQLVVSANAIGYEKDLQHPFSTSRIPYGMARIYEQGMRYELKYRIDSLLQKKLSLSTYVGFYTVTSRFLDTSSNVYNWLGEVERRKNFKLGEFGPKHDLFSFTNNLSARVNATYRITKNNSLNLNLISNSILQRGRDTLYARLVNKGKDIYVTPQYVRKNVAGLAYQLNLAKDKLINIVALKYYRIDTRISEGGGVISLTADTLPVNVSKQNYGFSEAIRYAFFKEHLFVKANYEYATRLPDQFEVLGDRVFIIPNTNLNPETSNNYNFGFQANAKGRLGKLNVEANRFYRDTRNNIFLVISQAFAQYQNIARVTVKGYDGEISYAPLPFIQLKVNATFQDIRNRSDTTVVQTAGIDKRYFNARLPTIPYYFGNAEIGFAIPNIAIAKDVLQVYYTLNYIQQFYIAFDIDGIEATKARVPEQYLQHAGIAYSLPRNRAGVSFEVHNFMDKRAFDNYKIEKPGRTFHVKLRYFLSKY